MSGDLDIGKLKGSVELEDNFSSRLDLILHQIESFDDKLGGIGKRIVESAAGFISAEAAIDGFKEAAHLAVETLAELTLEGSHAADIEATFDHLTEKAGILGDTLLEKASAGVRGTVTDLDLMTRVNQNLAVGLNLTETQMETVTNAAFSLAKATGGDVAQALDRVSNAMVTGRVRGIQLLTGKIDLVDAEQKFAASLGTTTDHLTASAKQHAIQEAIIDRLASATDRVGEQHVRLADKITQAKVELHNFEEEVGTAIATSPVLMSAIDGLADAFNVLFGGQRATTIELIAAAIDKLLTSVVDNVESIVVNARLMSDAFLGILAGPVNAKLDALIVSLEHTKQNMHAAAQAAIDGNHPIRDQADALGEAATQAESHARALARDEYVMRQTAEEAKKMAEALAELDSVGGSWQATLADIDGETVDAIKYYLEAGIAQDKLAAAYELTGSQVKAISQAYKAEQQAIKEVEDAEKILSGIYVERGDLYEADSVKLKHKALEDYTTEVNSAQARGVVTKSYYDALWAKMEETVVKANAARVAEDAGTREHYVKLANEARAAYDEALHGIGTYTNEGIAVLHEKMVQANSDLVNWQNLADKAMNALKKGADGALASVAKVAEKIHTLSGELISFDEWQKRHDAGGSFEVTSVNFNKTIDDFNHKYDGMSTIGMPPQIDPAVATALAKQGYSWQEIMFILFGNIGNRPVQGYGAPSGQGIPGFKDGSDGYVDFGEGTMAMLHGKEAIVPLGSGGAGGGITMHFHSMLTDAMAVRRAAEIVGDELMRRSGRKMPGV